MCNIINSPKQDNRFVVGDLFSAVASKILIPGPFILTAKDELADGPACGRAISYPMQNPIKNIITHPE